MSARPSTEPTTDRGGRFTLRGIGWWTGLLVVAIVVVNVAGVLQIATARRGVRAETARILALEATSRARAVESVLSASRADLAFLTRSPGFGKDREAPGWRDAVGASMLLFLRGHPEIAGLLLRTRTGDGVVEAGRPRGVPGFWLPTAATPTPAGTVVATFDVPVREPAGAELWLDATLDGAALLALSGSPSLACAVRDAAGTGLAGEHGPTDGTSDVVEAEIAAEGWTAPGPWRIACKSREEPAAALLEPVMARYRTTIVLDLVIMGFAILLGVLALAEARRRSALEARSREDARVHGLERQLYHAERLSTVGRLAAGIAHEVNNPLEGMSNYLRLAREALERGEGERARSYLAGVQEGLHRAASIVHRVLDHADRSALPRTAVDLNEVLERSVDFVRSGNDSRSVRFALELDPGGPQVQGSPVLLGQVFLNLLVNACQAQPAGGEVLVRTAARGGFVEAEVADRGPGVPAAERERIFEPFHSTKQSTGLGLSICHSIVRQHDGELTVRDRTGGGAVFVVRLKAVAEQGHATA